MIFFQYIILHLFVAFVTYYYCLKIRHSSDCYYWKHAFVPIVVFALEEGLRWGRNIDWCFYSNVYDNILDGSSNMEPCFRLFWGSIAFLGFPYYIAILLSSLLLIVSLFYFCRPYKNILYIAMPLLIFTTGAFASNLIRWYIAFSFMLIGARLYLDYKKILSYIFFIVSVLTHYAIILAIALWGIIFYSSKRKYCNAYVGIIVSIGLTFIMFYNKSLLMAFLFIGKLFAASDRFGGYLDDSSKWFTVQNDVNLWLNIVTLLPLYVVLLGAKGCFRDNKMCNFIYNGFLVVLWIKSLGQNLELALRFKAIMDPFICIMFGLVFTEYRRVNNLKSIIYQYVTVAFFLFQMYQFCEPYGNEKFNGYVWNQRWDPYYLLGLYKGWF